MSDPIQHESGYSYFQRGSAGPDFLPPETEVEQTVVSQEAASEAPGRLAYYARGAAWTAGGLLMLSLALNAGYNAITYQNERSFDTTMANAAKVRGNLHQAQAYQKEAVKNGAFEGFETIAVVGLLHGIKLVSELATEDMEEARTARRRDEDEDEWLPE